MVLHGSECLGEARAVYLSQVLVLSLALSYEVVELRREELGGHDGLLEAEGSRFMSLRL